MNTAPQDEYSELVYSALVADLRRGRRPPPPEILAALRAAGHSAENLVVDFFTEPAAGPQAGDPCTTCGQGRFVVATSKRIDDSQIRRIRCSHCRARPIDGGVRIVPAATIFRRRRKARRDAETQRKKRR